MMSTSDPYSSSGSDMIVAYFEDHLQEFCPPRIWTKSLIQRPVTRIFPSSSNPTRKIIQEESSLLAQFRVEADQNLAFEKSLQAAIDFEDFNVRVGKNDILEDTMEVFNEHYFGENVGQQQSVHFPVVSYLSPNLGLVAGARSIQQRVDSLPPTATTRINNKKRPRSSSLNRSSVMLESNEEFMMSKQKQSKSRLVQNLSDKVNAEMDSCNNFEQKLVAALNLQCSSNNPTNNSS